MNRVIACRRTKRSRSSASYSSRFLMPRMLSAGERLLVSLKTPPSRTGTYSKVTPVRSSISGMTR